SPASPASRQPTPAPRSTPSQQHDIPLHPWPASRALPSTARRGSPLRPAGAQTPLQTASPPPASSHTSASAYPTRPAGLQSPPAAPAKPDSPPQHPAPPRSHPLPPPSHSPTAAPPP